jgi:hypothetical protein
MARLPRFDLPGVAQHIVQRGNNRLPCFLDDHDRHRYLALLGEALRDTGCRLHAYVLMSHHVHLLATPLERGAAAYTAIVREVINEADTEAIRAFLQQQRAPGSDLFQQMVERRTRRFAGVRPIGRPCRRDHHLEIEPDPF